MRKEDIGTPFRVSERMLYLLRWVKFCSAVKINVPSVVPADSPLVVFRTFSTK